MKRRTIEQIHDDGFPEPERLVILTDGAVLPLGATEVHYPVYTLTDKTLCVEKKDVEIMPATGFPSIADDLAFAIVDEEGKLV